MSTVIHKYPLARQTLQHINLPIRAKVLHVAEQEGVICVWAAFDDQYKGISSRRVVCVSTGDTTPEREQYVGTVHLHHGAAVVHVFIDGERK